MFESITGTTSDYQITTTDQQISWSDYYPYGMLMPYACIEIEVPADNAQLIEQPVVYDDLVYTENSATGLKISTGAPTGWKAGANSVQTVNAGEYMIFEIGAQDVNDHLEFIGLSYQETGEHWNTIDYAWYMYSSGTSSTWINGDQNSKIIHNPYHQPGDEYSIHRENGNIVYKKNGVVKRTEVDAYPWLPMIVDISMCSSCTDHGADASQFRVYNLRIAKFDSYVTESVCYGNKSVSDYRYGFQGQEMDDEVKGEGNSANYKYRMHDPRIGRFFAVDPLAPKYPEWTPYAFSGNQVTVYAELEGLEPVIRLDSQGNPIPEVAGDVRAGVEGANNNINNTWNAYMWTVDENGGNGGWLNLGEVYLLGKHEGLKKSSESLPNGTDNVEITPLNQNGDYLVTSFTLPTGERFKKVDNPYNNGYWSSSGGMYSLMLNSDRSYAGNRFESYKQKSYFHKRAFGVKLDDDLWVDYALEAMKGTICDITLGLITGKGGNNVEGEMVFTASSDNYLDKQIKRFLMLKGPGSYLQMPTGMAWSPGVQEGAAGMNLKEYVFMGYGGQDFKPIFKITDIPFEQSIYGKPILFTENNGQ